MLDLEKLGDFIEAWDTDDRHTSELYMQLWALQMRVTTLLQLKRHVDIDSVVDTVLSLEDAETGLFRHNSMSIPDVEATHFALSTLDQLNRLNLVQMPQKITQSLLELLTEKNGFMGNQFTREVDSRITFYGTCALFRIGKLLKQEIDGETKDRLEQFVISTFNKEGGAGALPGAESHAMEIYVGVGILLLLGRRPPPRIEFEAKMYLLECRTETGGFCGRPNKLPDSCYAMWCCGTLELLGITDYGKDEMLEFILMCQDLETGGIADRPENAPDLFHSHYCLAWYCIAFAPKDLPSRNALLDIVAPTE